MKDAYYFSHDSNARTDPKILQMRSIYNSEGYGWYWMLIEMMREQEDYSLSLDGKYAFNAFALQLDTTAERCKAFVEDCINEFKLFKCTDTKLYSSSLKSRMKIKEEKSEKARESAKTRWSKANEKAIVEQTQSKSNANAFKNDAIKESKVKESKVKESKGNNNILKNAYTHEFEEWFNSYPNAFNKPQTFTNWKKLLKTETLDNIILATENYKAKIIKEKTEKQYITKSTNFIGEKQVYAGYLESINTKSIRAPIIIGEEVYLE